MKKTWKYVIIVLFFATIFGGIYLVSDTKSDMELDMKKADKLFDNGTFQEALNEYELIFKETTDPEIRWKAFFRICESLSHLYRYGEAAEKLISTPIPEQTPYRARILPMSRNHRHTWEQSAASSAISITARILIVLLRERAAERAPVTGAQLTTPQS